MELQKSIEISDARIQFVSLVDRAANLSKYLITKAEDGSAQFSSYGKIVKVDTAPHYVTGIVYEPMRADAHDNYMNEEEITKAARWFMKNSGKVDIQHSFEQAQGVSVVESYIAPCDMDIAGTPVTKGTWLMSVEITDPDIWEAVQKGEISGFSMGGVGRYAEENVELDTITKTEEPKAAAERRGFFKWLASTFGYELVEKAAAPVNKAGKKMSSTNKQKLDAAYKALSELQEALSEEETEDGDAIEKEENTDMNKPEITALVEETVKKSLEAAGIVAKEADPAPAAAAPAAEQQPAEPGIDIEATVEKAVQKALVACGLIEEEPAEEQPVTKATLEEVVSETVNKALEPLLKARGLSTNLNDTKPVEKAEPHYLTGIL